ncbi:MAG TPA: PAS domain S-box protein, partial [Methanomassiliicoccales archaeon]|nr:PAS domain S-box protein [Methanomassiliicoccales archaeon]
MKRERSYRTLAENLPGIVYRVNMHEKGRTQFFNKMITTMTGYTEEDFIEGTVCSIHTLIVAEDRDRIIAEVDAAVKENKGFYLEYGITHKDGTPRFFIERGQPIIDDDGLYFIDGIIQDVTKRKLAEHEAIRAREDWKNIFQAISHPTIILDPQYGIIDANKAALCTSGLSRAELLGNKCYEIFHRKDTTSPPAGCPMESMLASGQVDTVTGEMEASGANMLVSCTPVRNQQGIIEKIIHIMTDVTQMKRSEEALRSSERRLSDLIDFLPDATLAINKEGKVIAWNRAIEEMTKVKAADMLGKGDYEYALPFYGERKPILIDMALQSQVESDKRYRSLRKNGDILFAETNPSHLPDDITHLSVTASVLRKPDGEIVAAIECIRDDTRRRRAEKDLHQAEQRYRSIFENAQEGIYRTTPGGRIVTANPAMAKILGYTSPEELMTGITDVAHQLYVDPEERERIIKIIEEDCPAINREVQVYRKDGSIIWILMTIQSVRDEKEQTSYYEGMIEDITDRKQSTERLRKSLGATIQAMAVTVEARDPYTAGHQRRVAGLSRVIAMEMGVPTDQIEGLRMAAVIHDLGKISVPAEILSKPKKLSILEFSLIKTHAQSGYDILKDIDFPWPIARMVLEHHERMDGSGYPNGLVVEEILL